MCQYRWIEFLKDCDCTINYYLRRVNAVVDALSKKVQVARMMIRKWELLEGACEWNPKPILGRLTFGNIVAQPSLLT